LGSEQGHRGFQGMKCAWRNTFFFKRKNILVRDENMLNLVWIMLRTKKMMIDGARQSFQSPLSEDLN